jgi:antitoxin (DNA-binding transcriptional repressor) of toxin-antitoxin stability system
MAHQQRLCYVFHMPSIGIREPRERAIELLRRVAQGETMHVTNGGRPVAILSPHL